ncbi:MAG: hypothetical protein ABI461_14275, partial [Polyangiaceae bacterium]
MLLASIGGLGCSSTDATGGASVVGEAGPIDNADDQGDGGIVEDAGPETDADVPPPNVDNDGGCPVLAFPSGVNIQT